MGVSCGARWAIYAQLGLGIGCGATGGAIEGEGAADGPRGGAGGVSGGSGAAGGTPGFIPTPVETARPPDEACAVTTQTALNTLQPADIIMAVDNGRNMQEDILVVRDSLDAFSRQIVDSGVDARIILLTDALDPDIVSAATPLGGPTGDWRAICVGPPLGSGQCPDDSNPARGFYHLDVEVGDGAGFIATPERHALNMFTATYPAYSGWLRPEAAKTFVAITDQDAVTAPNNSVAAFTSAVTALDPVVFPSFTFSAIVAYSPCTTFIFPTMTGAVYLDLVAQTGGVSGDFCLRDFAPVFDDIANGVVRVVEVDCEWAIPAPPEGEALDPNEVNVALRAPAGDLAIGNVPTAADCAAYAGGWFYDDPQAPTRVIACPETCTMIRAASEPSIEIQYGCVTRRAELR